MCLNAVSASIHAACSGVSGSVYVNGKKESTLDSGAVWEKDYSYWDRPAPVVAIECTQNESETGWILASLQWRHKSISWSKSLFTGQSWKCVQSNSRTIPTNWMAPDFGDDDWPQAVVVNRDVNLTQVGSIPDEAKPIWWSSENDAGNTRTYCRGEIRE